jgi:tRNA(His) 5'-end guanylyltransferase
MKDDLGKRMKGYEALSKHSLNKTLPVIARIDGKAFHTFTNGLNKPWDRGFQESMWSAAKYAAERIQGCKLVYVQSDEVSFLLVASGDKNTEGWFNYKLQKITSVAASLVTGGFISGIFMWLPERKDKLLDGFGIPAFDARFFNIPKDEVSNYFYWRQADAIRNSVQMLARMHFSHKECYAKNEKELKVMLLSKGISWDEQEHCNKYGVCLKRVEREEMISYNIKNEVHTIMAKRNRWEIDYNIPIFFREREYVNTYLNF